MVMATNEHKEVLDSHFTQVSGCQHLW